MAFPNNPQQGDTYTPDGSSKTWFWDGSRWVLATGGQMNLDNLGDATTTNKAPQKNDLLAWDENLKDFRRKDASQVINENDAFVKELDDLIDVNIEDSKHVVGTKYNYYTAIDPTKADGFGRYSINLADKTITINKRDLDGNDASELAQQVTLSGSMGHIVTIEYGASPYSATTRITETPTISSNGNAYTLKYDNVDILQKISEGEDAGKVMFSIALNEFRGLADGAVLMYKQNTGQQWEPAFIDGAEGSVNVTLSKEPPASPDYNDLWIDAENMYMYIYSPTRSGNWGSWVAVTGPGGIDGGSDIVNNSTVTLLPNRGIEVASGGSFKLNQPKNHIIEFSPSNIVLLDNTPPAPDERLKSDIWIDTSDYKMYVWNEYEWVGLSSGDSDQTGVGFNYVPCELDGGGSFNNESLDCAVFVDGGIALSEYCDLDDHYQYQRPGVSVGEVAPKNPLLGQMWFDSTRMETRVFYGTENSTGRWVSILNPSSNPILPPDPNPEPVRVSGPNTAIAGVASENFTCVIGENLPLPSFAWSTTDDKAYIQPVGVRNVVQIVFSKTGTHKVAVTVADRTLLDDDGNTVNYTDYVKVVVTETPQNVAAIYEVLVSYDNETRANRYILNNASKPYLTFVRGRKYIFETSDLTVNPYPLRFYTDANGKPGDLFEDGVRYGDQNSFVEIQVANDAPAILHYESQNLFGGEQNYGNIIYVVGDYVADIGQLSLGTRPIISPSRLDMSVIELPIDVPAGSNPEEEFIYRYSIFMPENREDINDIENFVPTQQPELFFYAYGTVPGIKSVEYYTYTFYMTNPDNVNHPMGLFLDEDNTIPYEQNVEYFDGNTVMVFNPTDDMPPILFYGCKKHPGMGGKINILRSSN